MKGPQLVAICLSAGLLSLCLLYYFSVYDYESATQQRLRRYPSFDPLSECAAPFGTLLGIASGVPAFSNCNTEFRASNGIYYSIRDPMDVTDRPDPSKPNYVMGGLPYQAVDYIMRWTQHNRGLSPRLTDDPAGMWKKNYYFNPSKTTQDWESEYLPNYMEATTIEERKFVAPRSADTIIYSPMPLKKLKDGHAAVIVKVTDDIETAGGKENFAQLKRQRLHPRIVYIAEQNFLNTPWNGKNYSRVLHFRWRKLRGETYEGYLVDPNELSVLGRMRIGKPMPERTSPDPYSDGLNDGDL